MGDSLRRAGASIISAMLSMRKTGLSSPAYADWSDCVVYDDGRPIGRIYENPADSVRVALVLGSHGARCPVSPASRPVVACRRWKRRIPQLQANFKKWLVWAKLEEPTASTP